MATHQFTSVLQKHHTTLAVVRTLEINLVKFGANVSKMRSGTSSPSVADRQLRYEESSRVSPEPSILRRSTPWDDFRDEDARVLANVRIVRPPSNAEAQSRVSLETMTCTHTNHYKL